MALVGTCGFGTLLRLGGGDLKALLTFLVMAVTAMMAIRGATGLARIRLTEPLSYDLPGAATGIVGFDAFDTRPREAGHNAKGNRVCHAGNDWDCVCRCFETQNVATGRDDDVWFCVHHITAKLGITFLPSVAGISRHDQI
jgi:hypothetical protein